MSTLKCLKSFGDNKYGITRLYENEMVCEVLCRLVCKSHGEECIVALDLLSVICLLNRYACNKIVACFTKINKTQHKDRFQPLIVCLMNQNRISLQRSVMYFINTLLHSTQNISEHSVQLRLQLRKELYQLGFETYLNAYRQSDDRILCHQADIFLNKSHIDREDLNFEFLKLQRELSTLPRCQLEWDKLIRSININESSMIHLMQLLIFFINTKKTNCDAIIKYLNKKLMPSFHKDIHVNEMDCGDVLANEFQSINLVDCDSLNSSKLNGDEEIVFGQCMTPKSCTSLYDLDSTNSELFISSSSSPDPIKDSGLSQNFDRNHSSIFSISETDSLLHSSVFEEIQSSSDINYTERINNGELNTTVTSELLPLSSKDPTSQFSYDSHRSFNSSKKNVLSYCKAPTTQNSQQNDLRTSLSELFAQKDKHVLSPIKNISQCHMSSSLSLLKSPLIVQLSSSESVQLKLPLTNEASEISSQLLPPSETMTQTLPSVPICFKAPPPPPPPPPIPPPLLSGNLNQQNSTLNPLRESVKKVNVTLISEGVLNQNSIWSKIEIENYSNDLTIIDKIYNRFSSKKSVEIKKKIAKPLIVMDQKNAQNFEIFLLSLNMKNDVLIKAIREMDVKIFTVDMIGKLISYIPDPEKLVKLESYKNKFNDLRTCEQFIISLMAIQHYKPRLHGIHLQILISNKCLTDAEDNLTLVNDTFDKLLSSNRLKSLLEIILFLAKVMNPTKKVVGVSIDSFCKLIDTKDNNGGNLLEFIIEQLQETTPDCLRVWDDLGTLEFASYVSQETINSTIHQFSSCLKSVQSDIETIDCLELRTEIIANVELAKFLLLETNNLQKSVEMKYRQVCEYLSIVQLNYSFENLFFDLKTFKFQFTNSLKQIVERKNLEALRKLKLESRNKMKEKQLRKSDKLVTMLSSSISTTSGNNDDNGKTKYLFKPNELIDSTIIGISSGKIFCDEDALVNWNFQFHRKENHRHRAENIRNVKQHLNSSRTRPLDINQILATMEPILRLQ